MMIEVVMMATAVLLSTAAAWQPVGIRTTCTPRCKDMRSSGQWKCDKNALGVQYCNTFELADPHSCHYHYHTQAEVGKCLNTKGFDLIYAGASTMLGMLGSTFQWFDKTIRGKTKVDVLDWLTLVDRNDSSSRDANGYSDYPSLNAAAIAVDNTGTLTWKGGATYHTSNPYSKVLTAVPRTNKGLTFFNIKDFSKMYKALDELALAGRANSKAYIVISMGSWWYYCFSQGDWACNLIAAAESTQIKAAKGDVTAVLASYKARMTALAQRLHTQFPNYIPIFGDYGWTGEAGVNGQFLMGMYGIIKNLGDQYGYYLNIYQMATLARNAPGKSGDHFIHITNAAIFNRILSVACDGMATGTVECEEEIFGDSTCQWDPKQTSWYLQWQRPCDYSRYTKPGTSATVVVPNPTPVPAPCSNINWRQCAGDLWTGLKCCPKGTTCTYFGQWYSQCRTTGLQPSQPCDNKWCSNHGYCLQEGTKGVCVCDSKWSGSSCSVAV